MTSTINKVIESPFEIIIKAFHFRLIHTSKLLIEMRSKQIAAAQQITQNISIYFFFFLLIINFYYRLRSINRTKQTNERTEWTNKKKTFQIKTTKRWCIAPFASHYLIKHTNVNWNLSVYRKNSRSLFIQENEMKRTENKNLSCHISIQTNVWAQFDFFFLIFEDSMRLWCFIYKKKYLTKHNISYIYSDCNWLNIYLKLYFIYDYLNVDIKPRNTHTITLTQWDNKRHTRKKNTFSCSKAFLFDWIIPQTKRSDEIITKNKHTGTKFFFFHFIFYVVAVSIVVAVAVAVFRRYFVV